MDLINATINATVNATGASGAMDALFGVREFVDNTKEVVPYEAWMGIAIVLGLLVFLSKMPFISGMAKTIMYVFIACVAAVFLILLGIITI